MQRTHFVRTEHWETNVHHMGIIWANGYVTQLGRESTKRELGECLFVKVECNREYIIFAEKEMLCNSLANLAKTSPIHKPT